MELAYVKLRLCWKDDALSGSVLCPWFIHASFIVEEYSGTRKVEYNELNDHEAITP